MSRERSLPRVHVKNDTRPAKNFNTSDQMLLPRALREALHPKAPYIMLAAVLRYLCETSTERFPWEGR
jgi:hypothetical protein